MLNPVFKAKPQSCDVPYLRRNAKYSFHQLHVKIYLLHAALVFCLLFCTVENKI